MDQLFVAVDGSLHSAKVVDYAVQLAKTIPAHIVLVHVIPDPRVPGEYAEYAKVEGDDAGFYYEQISESILGKMSGRVKKAGMDCEVVTGSGNPADFILDLADRKKASLIVLGVFGLHNLGRIRSPGERLEARGRELHDPSGACPMNRIKSELRTRKERIIDRTRHSIMEVRMRQARKFWSSGLWD